MNKSTLFNETGNVQLYRITEETKKKVAKETKSIEDQMTALNKKSRERFRREENNRIRKNEQKRLDMIARWDEKTKNSPFRLNCVAHEEKRMVAWDNMTMRKEQTLRRNKTLKNMIGTSKFDICSKDKIVVFDGQDDVKLALALRRHTSDKNIVYRERSTLDSMLDTEFYEMRHKFPEIPALADMNIPLVSNYNSFRSVSSAAHCSSSSQNLKSITRAKTSPTKTGFGVSTHLSPIRSKSQGTALRVLPRLVADSDSVNNDSSAGNSFAQHGDSIYSGSGSVYKPPPLNPAEIFGKELDLCFPDK